MLYCDHNAFLDPKEIGCDDHIHELAETHECRVMENAEDLSISCMDGHLASFCEMSECFTVFSYLRLQILIAARNIRIQCKFNVEIAVFRYGGGIAVLEANPLISEPVQVPD